MISSVLNEGVRGLQNSQRELQKTAGEIARTNVQSSPVEPATAAEEGTVIPPVEEPPKAVSERDISEALVELRKQEQLFTASAQVVKVADQTLGSLIDVES